MSGRRTVVLFRERSEGDPYVAEFAGKGYDAICIGVLSFRFVNADRLAAALDRPSDFGGLILTSPRAVDAVRRTSAEITVWKELPAYVVGPETGRQASELGLSVTGTESGNVAELLPLVVESPPLRPLLFPCGNRRRDQLPDGLRQAGVPFEEIVVYETYPSAPGSLDPMPDPDWVVFFSPSGVDSLMNAFSDRVEQSRIAAIGATTAAAMISRGIIPLAVAERPEPAALVAAILKADGDA